VKELMDSGELGVPVVVQANAFEWFDPEPSSSRSWLLEQELSGGGPMFDFGCHRIEVLLDLLGNICDVKATLGNAFFDREVEDTATAIFQFDRGTCGTLTVTHAAREPQDTLDLYFTNGSIHIPVLNEGTMRVITTNGERVEKHQNHSNIHQPLIEEFARAVLDNRDSIVTGEIGRAVASIEEKMYR
jgi:predicted dehydrogenase